MDQTPHTRASSLRVDWSDPELESLLRKSESWSLDNRGGFNPQEIQLYMGWSGSVGRSALLVWERDKSMVVETNFPIGTGEHVRIDKHLGQSIRTLWGVVADGREGSREEDRKLGLHFYWLHVK
jgi:hypothetical protein